MPYTLLDQDALDELGLCLENDVSVIIGVVFASGILADEGAATYGYAQPPVEVVERVAATRTLCDRHGVLLAAAALQFPLAHPAVAAVIPGAVTAEQVRRNAAAFATPIPPALWDELKSSGLLRADAPVPSD